MGVLGIVFAVSAGLVTGAGGVWIATRYSSRGAPRDKGASPTSRPAKRIDGAELANQRLHQIAELAAAIFWATGEGGEGLVYMSPSARRIVGYEASEFERGRRAWVEIVHPDDRQRFLRELRAWEEGGAARVLTMEYRIRRADGETRWIRDVMTRVEDDGAGGGGVIGVAMDVSEEKRVSEQAGEMAEIVQRAPDLMGATTPDGTPLFMNAAGVRMLGISDPPPPGCHIRQLHPEWAWKIVEREGIPTAIREGVWAGETAFLTVEGREVPVHQVIVAHRDEQGRARKLSTIARDISEVKRTEREQTWMLRELDHRVKNNLALVGAIARQTAAGATDVNAYVESLLKRLQALSRVHAALNMGSWGGRRGDGHSGETSLEEVVHRCLAPFQFEGTDRLVLSGGDIPLAAREATPIGLAVFELAANAAKHGAWSVEQGTVEVGWSHDGAAARLTWTERDSACPGEIMEGSGLRLVRDCVEGALGGTVELRSGRGVFAATFTFNLHAIGREDHPDGGSTPEGDANGVRLV